MSNCKAVAKSLIPLHRILPNLRVAHVVKKLAATCGTRKFIAFLEQLVIGATGPSQHSIPRYIFMPISALTSHLLLSPPAHPPLLYSGFSTNTLHSFLTPHVLFVHPPTTNTSPIFHFLTLVTSYSLLILWFC
jgi:hypothetical protein